jgi:hypothetical protein
VVLEILEHPSRPDLEQSQPSPVHRVIAGVTRLTDLGHFETVPEALEAIDARLGVGIATPNHVLTVTGGTASHCPATEPGEVYDDIEPYPSVCHDNNGSGVRIYMADTGILEHVVDSHSWLAGVRGDPDPNQPHDVNGRLTIPPYAGHGTFAAGVARCMAPGAEIFVTQCCLHCGQRPGSGPDTGARSGARPRSGRLPSVHFLHVQA